MDLHAVSSRKASAARMAPRLRLSVLGALAALGLAACASAPASSMPMAMPSVHMALAGSAPPSSVPAGAVEVGIVNFAFSPGTVTIRVGTTVDWTNHDGVAHTVRFTGADIASGVLQANEHFSHTFTTPGTYAYICSIHPFMHGTVVVAT